MSDLLVSSYNPDVLNCLANLSNDEVFTPPEIANQLLDLLPKEIWHDKNAKFLDPAVKSGVFLREIAKRLIEGLKDEIPDLQKRIDHIFHEQLYGIAITELTSLLSRRSVYCSKYPHSKYSISLFDNHEGNIRFRRCSHDWDIERTKNSNGKTEIKKTCKFCGTSGEEYERDSDLETHAYEWIHTVNPERIFNMKFDVIISNPPYQLSDGGNGKSAKPIYQHFINQAKKLNPKYMLMITPSRWFNGGKGLDSFRKEMLSDHRISVLVDYQNAKMCFPGVSLGGGVSYFLWDRDRDASQKNCRITNILPSREITMDRPLDQFPVFIRYNDSIDIVTKVQSQNEENIVSLMSSRNPFGLSTNEPGLEKRIGNSIKLVTSKGNKFIPLHKITQHEEWVDLYKVLISRTTSEHAGEPDKSGKYKVIAKMEPLNCKEVCTDSYIIGFPTTSSTERDNFIKYLKTKFVRFLILQTLSSINLTRESYKFVPKQDFSKIWTDEDLYKKYNLTPEEIEFVEETIKPYDQEEK